MQKKAKRRNPRFYDGQRLTSHNLKDLLPQVLDGVSSVYKERGDLVIGAWPDIIGPNLASMTQAESFTEGILYVRVNNSTLFSLLSQNDKPQIIKKLRERFPRTSIRTVVFRMG